MDGLYIIISALIGAAATIASVLIAKRSKTNHDPILNETQNNENSKLDTLYLSNNCNFSPEKQLLPGPLFY